MNNEQIKLMLDLQNKMNNVIDSDWVNKGWDFMRASALEGGEAVEHHGWKWWKAQKPNIPQLQMEIVDIWHFILSNYIQRNKGDILKSLNMIETDLVYGERFVTFDSKEYDLKKLTLLEKLDLLIGLSCSKRVELGVFFSIANDSGLTKEDLFKQYIQKNVLNIFRQDFGYKEGTYIKIWNGLEDNEHLVEISSGFDHKNSDYYSNIYKSLETRYKDLNNIK